MEQRAGDLFERLIQTMEKLRGPEGCPWDRAQTPQSLLPYLVEEAYEVVEAVHRGDPQELCEELGDLLLQVVFHAQMAKEEGKFTIEDVVTGLTEKLIRRHPHVFGHARAETPEEVVERWEALKQQERDAAASLLEGIPPSLPALMWAQRLQERAIAAGFRWPDVDASMDKAREELEELAGVLGTGEKDRIAEELGDLLFTLLNVAILARVDAEQALRGACRKFIDRFQWVEAKLAAEGRSMKEQDLGHLLDLWRQAKEP
ncbi:MAG: nucleoside triphosphate pyrophosphohydrolase [Armatimonadota bacterium]|nr:nucleoside triphosphate pyrophosphohydrolase [Armatimonadota bacterium]MDR5703510.1 nucleoside triphosphate pyrophosphohydrolase [Armatimonadota bacterium]MDR7434448.1 nucleoside triphosphate pyrophosphohydrolase [Armatimonadota bacterium]